MKRATSLSNILILSCALIPLLSTDTHAAGTRPLLPDDIVRAGTVQLGTHEIYIPLPPIYPMQAASRTSGPDGSWFQLSFVPDKDNMPAWNEMISLLVLPGNIPARPTPSRAALQIIEAQLGRQCASKIVSEDVASPVFRQTQHESAAIILKCSSLNENIGTPSMGYHVAINDGEYIYILTRTATERTPGSFKELDKIWRTSWPKGFSTFALCPVGNPCIPGKPAESTPDT